MVPTDASDLWFYICSLEGIGPEGYIQNYEEVLSNRIGKMNLENTGRVAMNERLYGRGVLLK